MTYPSRHRFDTQEDYDDYCQDYERWLARKEERAIDYYEESKSRKDYDNYDF